MKIKASDLSLYIQEAPPELQAALTRLRDLCRETLLDFEEAMEYGGSCYKRNGEVEAGFPSQTHLIGLYILRTDVMNAHRAQPQGKGISLGKGVIRYSRSEHFDFKVVERLLHDTVKSTGPIC